MIDPELLWIDGSVLCVFGAAFVAASFCWNPRVWLGDMPADIQELATPMTDAERRMAVRIGVPFVALLFTGLVISTMRFGAERGFWAAALHAYLIFQVFNLFDLLVIDWGGTMLIDPAKPPIAGTENARGYRDFGFHAKASLKGVVLGIPFAFAATGLAWPLM